MSQGWQVGAHRTSGAGGALVALLLFFGPLAYRCLLRPRPAPPVFLEFTSFVVYAADIVAALVIVTAAWRLGRNRRALDPGPWPATLPLALLPLLALVSVGAAEDSALAAHFSFRLMYLFVLYLALVNIRAQRHWIVLGAAAAGVAQATVGIFQFWRQADLGLARLGELELAAETGGYSVLNVGGEIWLRAYGLTPHPNILGGFLVVWLLICAEGVVGSAGPLRYPLLLTFMLMLAGLAVTFSRAAGLALVVSALVFVLLLLLDRQRRRVELRVLVQLGVAAAVAVATVFVWRGDLLWQRLAPQTASVEVRAASERQELAQMSHTAIAESPWRGLGAGNFALYTIPRTADLSDVGAQPVHHVPLLVAAELGIPAGLLWIWLMAAPIVLGVRRWVSRSDDRLLLALTCGLLALAIVDLFDYYAWGWPQGRLLRWPLLGLWSARWQSG